MGTWGVGLGRWFGVEVRLHGLSLLLLTGLIAGAAATGESPARALALWLLLTFAVLLRELARLFAALAMGLDVRRLLLTPLGGLPTFAAGRLPNASAELTLCLSGVLTSFLAGSTLFALALTFAPTLNLLQQPWISPTSLLRGLVWSNFLLAALHLLPATPLDAGRLFRAVVTAQRGPELAQRAANGLSRVIVMACLLLSIVRSSPLLANIGALLFFAGSLDRQAVHAVSSLLDPVRMRDVMLEDFFTLSSADTLEEAVHRALHAAQDVFPVVRSGSLVGSVSRRRIVDAFERSGNGYVQGVMTRDLVSAHPDDRVLPTLERLAALRSAAAQLVPVVEGDRVIGIVTPQNLSRSSRLLASKRRLRRPGQ